MQLERGALCSARVGEGEESQRSRQGVGPGVEDPRRVDRQAVAEPLLQILDVAQRNAVRGAVGGRQAETRGEIEPQPGRSAPSGGVVLPLPPHLCDRRSLPAANKSATQAPPPPQAPSRCQANVPPSRCPPSRCQANRAVGPRCRCRGGSRGWRRSRRRAVPVRRAAASRRVGASRRAVSSGMVTAAWCRAASVVSRVGREGGPGRSVVGEVFSITRLGLSRCLLVRRARFRERFASVLM